MDSVLNSTVQLIRESVWGSDSSLLPLEEVESVYALLREHGLLALPTNVISKIPMNDSLRTKWRGQLFQQLFIYNNVVNAQQKVLSALVKEGIQTVVLKGTSASQYYPIPEYRAMGDIDFLVKNSDLYRAKDIIESCGYAAIASDISNDRHISLSRGYIQIELHNRFASEKVIGNPKKFDELLFNDMSLERTKLSDPINGLVLIEHIAQHLNGGIGLRQIIDWMMFVYHCLDDHMWEQRFCQLVEMNGLAKLSIYITRMCQIHLGLTENKITWCLQAEDSTCNALFNYIVNCGNFGHSRNSWESGEITKLPSLRHPVRLFKYLQQRGQKNWLLAQKYPILRPFSWIYQITKYVKMRKNLNSNGISLKSILDERIMRKDLFAKVGIPIED